MKLCCCSQIATGCPFSKDQAHRSVMIKLVPVVGVRECLCRPLLPHHGSPAWSGISEGEVPGQRCHLAKRRVETVNPPIGDGRRRGNVRSLVDELRARVAAYCIQLRRCDIYQLLAIAQRQDAVSDRNPD